MDKTAFETEFQFLVAHMLVESEKVQCLGTDKWLIVNEETRGR